MDPVLSAHHLLVQAQGVLESTLPVNIETARNQMEQAMSIFPKPKSVREQEAWTSPIQARWFIPKYPGQKVILYLHGGAYAYGSINSHQSLMSWLALAGQCRVFGINYRLAPEHPFPAGLEDSVQAVQWLYDNEVSPEQLIIGGDSAGGGLTVATMLKLRELGLPQPAGGVLLCPWANLERDGHNDPSDWVRGSFPATHPLLSPVFADLSGLPPLLIQGGTRDNDFPDARDLAENCERDGVPVDFQVFEDCFHDWQVFMGSLPQARKALWQVGEFIQKL